MTIRCPDCRSSIPVDSRFCPDCGARIDGDEPYDSGRRAPKSSRVWWIVGLAGGALLLGCGGCCTGLFWIGIGEIERNVQADLQDDPVIQEHLGDVQSVKWKVIESITEGGEGVGGEDEYVFEVQGTKGRGRVIAVTESDALGNEAIVEGRLELDGGDTFPLVR